MKTYVSIHGMDVNSDVAAYLKRRLLFAVSRFATRIERIEADLIDISGERGAGGGVDKRCRIVAMVTGIGRLVVQDDDCELLPLIDRITDRFGRLVERKVELRLLRGGARSMP